MIGTISVAESGGDIPVGDIFEYHKKTGKLPSTITTNLEDYIEISIYPMI